MSKWHTSALLDIVELIGGGTPKTSVESYWNGDIPWLSVKDFNNNKRYVYSTEKHISQEGLENSSAKLLQKDDIIISARGTVGELAMIPSPMAFNQSCYGVRGKRGIDQTFLYYLIKNSIRQLKAMTHGSVFDTITRDTFSNIFVSLPDIKTQRAIALLLSNLDDKIEENELINQNLEEQAKTLFKAWLVDFIPFGGQIPDDWGTIFLSDIADFIGGYSYKGSELIESNTAMATIKNFERNGGFKLDGYKEIVPSDKIKKSQYADIFDILVAHTDLTQNADVIGNAELVLSKSGYKDIIFSMDLVKVISKNKNISNFLIASVLKDERFKAHCLGYVNGTTVLHLNKKALPEYSLAFPHDVFVLKPLDQALTCLYKEISQNIEEIRQLEMLRNTLLPKLMSGELDVSDIDV